MWRFHSTVRLTLILLLTGLLPACGGGGASGKQGDTIVFGTTISMTGPLAKESEYSRDGYLLAISTINKRGGIKLGGKTYKAALKYYDDGSQPERTAQLYEKLIAEDHVDLLLGPFSSGLTGMAAPIAEQYRMPMIAPHGSAESIYEQGFRYTFGVVSPAKNYLRGIIAVVLAKDPGAKTVALLGEDEPFAKEVVAGAAEYAEERGMTVVFRALYPTRTQDVSVMLTAINNRHPDLLLGAGHLQDTLLIARQAKDLGVSPKAMGFSVGPSAPEFRANLKRDADYIFGATQWTSALNYHGDDPWETPQAYAAAFRAQYPAYDEVPYQAAESTVALIAYARAIERANTLAPDVMRDTLAGLDMMTFYGRIKFDTRGVNIYKPMAVEQLQPDGRKYTVFPHDVAEREALYPMPPWEARR